MFCTNEVKRFSNTILFRGCGISWRAEKQRFLAFYLTINSFTTIGVQP